MKKRVFVVTALAAMMLVSACGKKNEIVEKAAAAKEVASVVKDAVKDKAEAAVKDAVEEVAPGSTIKREDYEELEGYLMDVAYSKMDGYCAPLRQCGMTNGDMILEYSDFKGKSEVVGYFKYLFNDERKQAVCTAYDREAVKKEGIETLVVEAEVNGYQVIAVNFGAGSRNQTVKKVVIEDGIQQIRDSFFGFEALEEVEIPESVRIISSGSFIGCKNLKQVTLPKDLLWLDAFSGSGITSLEVPEHVLFLGGFGASDVSDVTFLGSELQAVHGNAFHECKNLTSLHLPDSVHTIGNGFLYGSNVSDFTVPASFTDIDSHLNNMKTKTMGGTPYAEQAGEFIIWNDILVAYNGELKDAVITVPDGVKKIPSGVFYGDKILEELIIPEGVEVIGNGQFHQVRKLTLPSTLVQIGNATVENNAERDANIGRPHTVCLTGDSKFVKQVCENEHWEIVK